MALLGTYQASPDLLKGHLTNAENSEAEDKSSKRAQRSTVVHTCSDKNIENNDSFRTTAYLHMVNLCPAQSPGKKITDLGACGTCLTSEPSSCGSTVAAC